MEVSLCGLEFDGAGGWDFQLVPCAVESVNTEHFHLKCTQVISMNCSALMPCPCCYEQVKPGSAHSL